jgi:addiction module HigA family antidote
MMEALMPRKRLLDPIHPGEIRLEDFMKPLGISINKLARNIAVPPGRISTIVAGEMDRQERERAH